MNAIETRYTVALRDCPSLSVSERIAAEAAYARSLERLLGGPECIVETLASVQRIQEQEDDDASPEARARALATINRWAKAAAIARQAGLGELQGEARTATSRSGWTDHRGPDRHRHSGRCGSLALAVP
ncbi:hypothetical protein AVME950_00470 [Acidovorax sp. SUPP950]|uniref:hypothetical protein n=1 Tax=Acidovorax sp. SUPP950 TaxID=511901 RepID=UPI0023C02BE6|nr:hypothetical protein [Acidovorax sp. SUPP950]GKS73312.1 hypothetical protein AVME950_00470 [Acidovorax sp. SUPP950]